MLLFCSPSLCPTKHQTDLPFNLLQLLSQELQHSAGGICLPATSGVGQNNGIMLGCCNRGMWMLQVFRNNVKHEPSAQLGALWLLMQFYLLSVDDFLSLELHPQSYTKSSPAHSQSIPHSPAQYLSDFSTEPSKPSWQRPQTLGHQ